MHNGAPDAFYTSDDHSFRENDPYARAKYDLTMRWLAPVMKHGVLLYNVGVGGGYFNHLASARSLKIAGCEPDAEVFARALATAPPGVELFNCTLEEFAEDRPPAKFVVMHDVLEHIEDDARAVRALRKLVTADGTIVVSVPALAWLFGLHDEKLGHFRRYDGRTLRAVLEPEFVVQRFQWYGMASIPIALYYSRLARKPYPAGATRSLVGQLYGTVCSLESYLPEPIGTSIVVQLKPRNRT